ncbi:GH3 auxin-responsive promoter [Phlebopus sp. FC_14]|nr:GH3 auxin-responsive promoter [Phlebopus sp. FC_14]
MPGPLIPEPIHALTPELFDRLKERTEGTLTSLIRKNKNSRYTRECPLFSDFNTALAAVDAVDEAQVDTLLESYRTCIPLTSYDSYEPFVTKFFEPNCKEADIKDMFSPGLPYFIAVSSATSSKTSKFFAKYSHESGTSYESVNKNSNPESDRGGKNCIVYSLNYRQLVEVQDDQGSTVKKIPVTVMSSGTIRMQNNMGVEKDPYLMHAAPPRVTSPIAVSYIRKYRSFLLMHVLFALADTKLETMNTFFGPVFIDMMRYMEEEWDTLLNSIETGTLPDWEGIDHVRKYLQPHFPARPERAAGLRAIGKATHEPGWLVKIWPMFRVVIAIASGVFASVIPKMRHYLGPTVFMQSLGYTASETYIGMVYDPSKLNLYKVASDDIIEYLDVLKEDSASNLVPAWEVKAGSKYEIVVTTRDGLWRYRIGDIVQVNGFDPNDGSPILQFVERRNVAIRLGGAMTSEKQLTDAIFAAQDVIGPLVEFTIVVDDRTMPPKFGYIVEVQGEIGPEADRAPELVAADLCRSNPNVKRNIELQTIGSPTIRIVKPGTFRDYRQRKVESTDAGSGQAKVPVVMWDPVAQAQMLERVEREVGVSA